MKKRLIVGDMKEFKKFYSDTAQIVAGRAGKEIWIQNLEFFPDNAVSISKADGEITIKIKLKDGDYLVIQDDQGMTDKRML